MRCTSVRPHMNRFKVDLTLLLGHKFGYIGSQVVWNIRCNFYLNSINFSFGFSKRCIPLGKYYELPSTKFPICPVCHTVAFIFHATVHRLIKVY